MTQPRHPIIIIPTRLAATRLPNKPLAEIAGDAMIVQVWRRAIESGVGPVVVASADAAIVSVIAAAGGRAMLTDPALPTGSDRVFAALRVIDPGGVHDAVINLQGDLPAIDPGLIRAVMRPLDDADVDIGTLAVPTGDPDEAKDPNVVKTAVALAPGARVGRALYFSRAAIPSGPGPVLHHIGIYAYRPAALARFVSLPPSPLERRERLEQLRAMEAGMRIDVALVDSFPLGVDTPADLERVRALFAQRAAR
jgi:3-deoxy-manno-octulosonate cytidylyltransferase (CMP-KDO synthetase)